MRPSLSRIRYRPEPPTRATFQNFVGLGAGGRRPVRALMGPWTHGGKTMGLSYAGDVEFGPDAALPSFDELHLRWYDRWLRGVDNGLDAEAPLRIFVMGGGSGRRSGAGRLVHGGRWRDEHEWPLARTRFVRDHPAELSFSVAVDAPYMPVQSNFKRTPTVSRPDAPT